MLLRGALSFLYTTYVAVITLSWISIGKVRGPLVDDELSPEQKFAADGPEVMIPRMLKQGRSVEEVVKELVRLDWSASSARALVLRYVDDLQRIHDSLESSEKLLQEIRLQMAMGGMLALAGVGITVVTLLAALAGEIPFFIVAFGLFLGGTVMLLHGWNRMNLYRESEQRHTESESKNQ